jgi:hypothetical protein
MMGGQLYFVYPGRCLLLRGEREEMEHDVELVGGISAQGGCGIL